MRLILPAIGCLLMALSVLTVPTQAAVAPFELRYFDYSVTVSHATRIPQNPHRHHDAASGLHMHEEAPAMLCDAAYLLSLTASHASLRMRSAVCLNSRQGNVNETVHLPITLARYVVEHCVVFVGMR